MHYATESASLSLYTSIIFFVNEGILYAIKQTW